MNMTEYQDNLTAETATKSSEYFMPYEVKGSFSSILSRFKRGEINQENLKNIVSSFKFIDDDGVTWTIGLKTNEWYYFDNGQWKSGEPGSPLKRKEEDGMRTCLHCGSVNAPETSFCQGCGESLEEVPYDQSVAAGPKEKKKLFKSKKDKPVKAPVMQEAAQADDAPSVGTVVQIEPAPAKQPAAAYAQAAQPELTGSQKIIFYAFIAFVLGMLIFIAIMGYIRFFSVGQIDSSSILSMEMAIRSLPFIV